MIDNLSMATRTELEEEITLLEEEYNKTRDELKDYIKSTEKLVKEKSDYMDELSDKYNKIKNELKKRDGKPIE